LAARWKRDFLYRAGLDRLPRWQSELSKDLKRRLKKEPEVLKLSPTERSQPHG